MVYVRGESHLPYCDAFDYWGQGTQVTVTTATQTAPASLFALAPCGSGGDAGMLSVGCLASGYFPTDSITFKWTDGDGKSLSNFLQYPSVKSGATYSAVSQLQINAADWDGKKSFECVAEHPAGQKATTVKPPPERPTDNNTPNVKPPPEKSCLDVILKNPKAKDLFFAKTANLECIVTGRNEADVDEAKITWKVNSVEKIGKDQPRSQLRKSSVLSLTAQEWESGASVECSVQQKNGPPFRKVIKTKSGNFLNPIVSIFAPRDQDIGMWFQLVCLVNVSHEGDIYVAWRKGDGSYEDGLTGEPVSTGNIMCVTSIFIVSKEEWEKGTKFSCDVAHSFSKTNESPFSKSISKSNERQENSVCVDEGILDINESDSPWYTALSFIILFLFTFVYSAFLSLHQVKQ